MDVKNIYTIKFQDLIIHKIMPTNYYKVDDFINYVNEDLRKYNKNKISIKDFDVNDNKDSNYFVIFEIIKNICNYVINSIGGTERVSFYKEFLNFIEYDNCIINYFNEFQDKIKELEEKLEEKDKEIQKIKEKFKN
jgi:hypothetical protein